jgi:anti-sigma regulatory factor (Ser/Thr protein kinase)
VPLLVFGYSTLMTSANPPSGPQRRWSAQQLPRAGEVDLRFDVNSLHELRSTLAAHASLRSIPDEQVGYLQVVATELATNAIRHGGGTGRLRMWDHDGTLYCQVSDHGPGIADLSVGTTPPDPRSTDGHRGLWICRNLAADLTITANPDGPGATVTAAIPVPAVEDRPGPADK